MSLFCWIFVWIIPLLIFGLAVWFGKYPPKKINGFCGYRTERSMKSQETWDFAQRAICFLWKRLGLGMLVVTAVMNGLLSRMPAGIWAVYVVGAVLLQTVLVCVSIWPVENALKQRFDENGKPKGKTCPSAGTSACSSCGQNCGKK